MPTAEELKLEKSTSSTDTFSLHWGSVIAGTFVVLITYSILSALGVAIGATQLKPPFISSSTAVGEIGMWVFVSALISLFLGAYASSRVSGFIATRVGYIQGAVISAAFFALMILQTAAAVGFIGAGFGGIKNSVQDSARGIASNPRIVDLIEDSFSGIKLKSDVKDVAAGLMSRLAYGDTKSAVGYLADQTGMSVEDAQSKYIILRQNVTELSTRLTQEISNTTQKMAWFSFALMLFGTAVAMFGGAVGAQFSMRKPIDNLDRRALRAFQVASGH